MIAIDRTLFCALLFIIFAGSQAAASDTAEPHDPKLAGHFSGQVMDPVGKPLSGARIYIARFYDKSAPLGPVRAETDADGRFEFDAPDMTFEDLDGLPSRREGYLIAAKEGYAPDWMRTWGADHEGLREYWDPVKGAAIELQLAQDDVPIHGRFLDSDGKPLSGARVKLTELRIPSNHDLDAHIEHWSKASVDTGFLTRVPSYMREIWRPQLLPGLRTETQTDADGRFTFTGLGRDRLVELKVSAPGVLDTTIEAMTRDAPDVGTFVDYHGKTTQTIYGAGFTLELKPGRTISGIVRDRDTHQPIAGMHVGPLVNAVATFSRDLYPFVTDERGHFAVHGLPRYKQTIVAVAGPGLPYDTAWVEVPAESDAEIVIECSRAIGYQLKLVDEAGNPVNAEVSSIDIHPNPYRPRVRDEVHWPINVAAKREDGTYEGFVLPGPAAVLVKVPELPERMARRAAVDPKAFFAPGKTDWTEKEKTTSDAPYGTKETLTTSEGQYLGTRYRGWTIQQHDYDAIVLVNPAADSGPLELSATVVKDTPRQVTLTGPDAMPIVGAQMRYLDRYEPHLRAATFPLRRLHPDRVRRITFMKKDRQLIAFLAASGDSDEPYTVHMERWGSVKGRLLDENGSPLVDAAIVSPEIGDETASDVGLYSGAILTDSDGRFAKTSLVPGLRYSGKIYHGNETKDNKSFRRRLGTAFTDIVLKPGEVRNLGDIRAGPVALEE